MMKKNGFISIALIYTFFLIFLSFMTFLINSYEVLDIENYKYTKCSNDKCNEYQASVVPKSGMKIIKFNVTNTSKANLFNYLNLEYSSNDKVINLKNNIRVVTPENYQEGVLVEAPKEALDSQDLKFIFNLWGYKFSVK